MEALEWARAHGAPDDEPDVVSDLPWARVTRVGDVWLKECHPVQAHEVLLTTMLAWRWQDRVPAVRGADADRGWLLIADAGSPVAAFGDRLDAWMSALPLYAELQQRETQHVDIHLAYGVPDQRVDTLLAAFDEYEQFRGFAPRFRELCARLTLPPTVQHDDLHDGNVFSRNRRVLFIDWGDTVIAHPFGSLLIAVRSYVDIAERLRDAYLEAWGRGYRDEFDAAYAIAGFARILSWERIADGTRAQRAYAARDANIEWFLENIVNP